MTERKEFTLTAQEIITCPSLFQSILFILKEKGAPVKGTFFLRVEDGWTVSRHYLKPSGDAVYVFEKETPASAPT